MATRPLGESFAPTAATDDEQKKLNPAQQAIQVLSMRLPRIKGARSISPLVGEPGSAARRETPGGFSPESAVLQTLMQAGGDPSGPMGSMPGGGSDPFSAAMSALGGGMMNAAPVITPGIEDPGRPLPPIVPGPEPAPSQPQPGPLPPDPMPRPRPLPEPGTPAPRVPQDDTPDQRIPRDPRTPAPAPVPAPPVAPAPGPQVDPRMIQALMQMLGGGRF